MYLEEKIKEMFRKGDYSITSISESYTRSVDIYLGDVCVTAYPDTGYALAVVKIELSKDQTNELKRRMLEKIYNEKKGSLSEIETEMRMLELEN